MMARVVNIAVCLMIAFDLVARPAAGAVNIWTSNSISRIRPSWRCSMEPSSVNGWCSTPFLKILDSRLGRWPRCTLLRSGRAAFPQRPLCTSGLGKTAVASSGEKTICSSPTSSQHSDESSSVCLPRVSAPLPRANSVVEPSLSIVPLRSSSSELYQVDFRNESISACNASLVTARDISRSVGLSTLRWDAAGPQHRHGSASFATRHSFFSSLCEGAKRTRSLAHFLTVNGPTHLACARTTWRRTRIPDDREQAPA